MSLPFDFQPPAADPEGERHVREAAGERLRRLLDGRPGGLADADASREARAVIREELAAYNRSAVQLNLPRLPEGDGFVRWIEDGLLFYGPLTPALRDPLTEEIFVDRPDRLIVVREGRHILTALTFDDEAHLLATIKRLAADAGRRIDEAWPLLEGRLPHLGRVRVHAAIPPVAHPWPTITIRKHPADAYRLPDLWSETGPAGGMLTEAAGRYLLAAARAGASILVVGRTGSGKTTLLGALLLELGGLGARIVAVEEVSELPIEEIPFAVGLETRPPNVEGAGEITARMLIRTVLRMRPGYLVLGEARGGETYDLLQGMATGHPSLLTAHAHSARDGLKRLATLLAMAGEGLDEGARREMVEQAIDLVVALEMDAGHRRIAEIWERTGLEGNEFLGHAVFTSGADGRLRRTGLPSRWDVPNNAASGSSPNGHAAPVRIR